MEIIRGIKRTVGLFPRDWTGDDHRSRGLIANLSACVLSVAEQEVGIIVTTQPGAPGCVLRPSPVEANQTASGVGLKVVVEAHFELPAKLKGVPSLDPGDLRRKVPLSVVVGNCALALAAAHQSVAYAETGS
jgi:hypothetical protein